MNSLNKFIRGFVGGMAFTAIQNLSGRHGNDLFLESAWAVVFVLMIFSLLRDMWTEFFRE